MLELESVTRKFEKTIAVNKLSFQLRDQEFLVIFGPAGAGKSTTLRLIAGIIQPTHGEIRLNGRSMNKVPPEHRNMSMVFENYALYSAMSVYDNLAFPLRSKKITESDVKKRINKMAETLQITELLDRKPGFLSGGQRQRVALGRALIREADVYLLDEPISHLDAKLRHLMRAEIKAMCSERGATVVYVTHDYKEAMALSDRMVVLNKGISMQIGTPDQVYHQPENEFVASFLGDPSMSFQDATLKEETNNYYLEVNQLHIPISQVTAEKITAKSRSGKVRLGSRASELSLSVHPTDTNKIPTEVYVVETFGYRNIVTCECRGAGLVQAVSPSDLKINIHETVFLDLSEETIHLFAPDGEAISHPIHFKNGEHGGNNGIH
jgi:multiple sugar transport system ATP-binding protein